MGNLYSHENSEVSEATLGLQDILEKGENGENGVFSFRSENGQFTGNLLSNSGTMANEVSS